MIYHCILLILVCLQSFTMAQSAVGSDECCFEFVRVQIPAKVIKNYNETRTGCTYHGVILSLFNGRRVCANPSLEWVQRTMKKIDRRLFESANQPVTKSL